MNHLSNVERRISNSGTSRVDFGELWDKVSDDFTLLSSKSNSAKVVPYKVNDIDEIYYCSDDISFLSALSESILARQKQWNNQITQRKASTFNECSNNISDLSFSSRFFSTPDKKIKSSSRKDSSHNKPDSIAKIQPHITMEKPDSDGFFTLPIDTDTTLELAAADNNMLEENSIHYNTSKKLFNSKKSLETTENKCDENYKKTPRNYDVAKHLFGIAMREKRNYDSKKSELKFIKGYLKDLLFKVQHLKVGSDSVSTKSDNDFLNYNKKESTGSLTDSTHISQLIKNIDTEIKGDNNYEKTDPIIPNIIHKESINLQNQQDDKNEISPEILFTSIQFSSQLEANKVSHSTIDKNKNAHEGFLFVDFSSDTNKAESRVPNLQEYFNMRNKKFIERSKKRQEQIKNIHENNSSKLKSGFKPHLNHKFTKTLPFKLSEKKISLPKVLQPEIKVWSKQYCDRMKEYRDKLYARNKKMFLKNQKIFK
ncbi:MAG: hypothetical protein MHMPM18_003559 [Marteilia pararefringens]